MLFAIRHIAGLTMEIFLSRLIVIIGCKNGIEANFSYGIFSIYLKKSDNILWNPFLFVFFLFVSFLFVRSITFTLGTV